jgi:hypothetical protein
LGIGEIGIAAFGIAAMTQSHELGAEIDAGCGAYRCHTVAKVIHFPRKAHVPASVWPVTRYDQRAIPRCRIEARHQFRPKHRAVFVVKWNVDELPSLVMENTSDVPRIVRAIMDPAEFPGIICSKVGRRKDELASKSSFPSKVCRAERSILDIRIIPNMLQFA